jgi:hypothetical protein
MTKVHVAVALGLWLSLTTLAGAARALPVAETAGRGQFTGGVRFGSDDLNLGLGARGGYTLPMNVFIGGTFDYFFGEGGEVTGPNFRSEWSYSLWAIAFEGGYDFQIVQNLVIRPFGGLGFARVTAEVCTEAPGQRFCVDASESDAMLTLGGLLYYIADPLIVGPELRLLVADGSAFLIGGNVGLVF